VSRRALHGRGAGNREKQARAPALKAEPQKESEGDCQDNHRKDADSGFHGTPILSRI
jgi:hypothetical protein